MRYRKRFWAVALLGLLSCPSIAQQPAPKTISAKAGKAWAHKPSGIALPARIDDFIRSNVQDLSGGPLLDVSIVYDDQATRTHANVYIYHAAKPATALWFDVASTMIATNDHFGAPTPQGEPTAFALPGSDVMAGLRQDFAITKLGRSSGVAVIGIGDWVVKLRMTSPSFDPAQLDTAMARMMQQLGWPKKRPPLAPAAPLKACASPLSFGPAAEKAKQDSAAVLLGAMMGNLATSLAENSRKAGEAPKQPALCVHPDRIAGRLPIYQHEGEAAGYTIPLGDSGELLAVGQDSLSGLLLEKEEKDTAPTPWSVTVMKLDRWLQYPSYTAMPPPAQAIGIIQTESPLSTTSVYGKGSHINLSPDALKE